MAVLPTLQDTERAILDLYQRRGTRPGESIEQAAVEAEIIREGSPYRRADLTGALNAMFGRKLIEVKRQGWYTLTEAGYAAV